MPEPIISGETLINFPYPLSGTVVSVPISMRDYILFNKLTAPPTNFDIGCYPPGIRLTTARFIPINIYTKLTKNELKDLKKFFEIENKKLPRYQPLKYIDRNLKVEEEHKDRKKMDWEEGRTYKISVSEIAESLLDNNKKTKQVHEIIRNLKELREKRFRKNGKV